MTRQLTSRRKIMIVSEEKEVRFDQYCRECVHSELEETEDPCNDCLDYPVNTYSRKPVRFKAKEDN